MIDYARQNTKVFYLVRSLTPSVTSITSVAKDKGVNETIPGTVHRFPGIYLMAEENPGKPQSDRLMKGLWDQSSPQMGPFPPNEVARIAQHVRK